MEKKEGEEINKKSDMGLVIGTKEDALWQRVKETAEKEIQACKNTILIQEELLKIATEKTKHLNMTATK